MFAKKSLWLSANRLVTIPLLKQICVPSKSCERNRVTGALISSLIINIFRGNGINRHQRNWRSVDIKKVKIYEDDEKNVKNVCLKASSILFFRQAIKLIFYSQIARHWNRILTRDSRNQLNFDYQGSICSFHSSMSARTRQIFARYSIPFHLCCFLNKK